MSGITNLFSSSEFYVISGIDQNTINTNYVDSVINILNNMTSDILGGIFSFSQQTERLYVSNSPKISILKGLQPAGVISEVTITNGGSGYTTAPAVTITGDGSGAELEAITTDGVVTAINVIKQGKNYTTATVNITGDGTGASATASISEVTIVKGHDLTDQTTNLVLYTDYRYLFFEKDSPTEFDVVQAILLYSNYLNSEKDYLQITGTFGRFPCLPYNEEFIKLQIYDLVKGIIFDNENSTNNAGAGEVVSASIGDVSTDYGFKKNDQYKGLSITNSWNAISGILKELQYKYSPSPSENLILVG